MNKIINFIKKRYKKIIITILGLVMGIFLFLYVYRGQDFNDFLEKLQKLQNYWIFLPCFIFAILSHIFRARRWQMLIDNKEEKTRFSNTFFSVLNGYLFNAIIPRSGEVIRCVQVSNLDNIKFSKVVGTMVSERIIDVVLMFFITIATILFQTEKIKTLIIESELGKNLEHFLSPTIIFPLIIIGLLFLLLFYFIIKGRFNRWKIFEKFSNFIKNFWEGFREGLISLKDVKKPFWFIFHSVSIWVCYFLEFFICFFAFKEVALCEINFNIALTAFVAGSYGMLAPTQSGIGAYHFMVIQTLILYGIIAEYAQDFAFVVHFMQTIYILVLGVFSMICTFVLSRRKKKKDVLVIND